MLLLLACAVPVCAETVRYVSDNLEVTLRSGKTLKHSILRMLPSGAQVTVLENDDAEGYSKVRTQDGAEGWVLTRFLSSTPSARDRLADAQQKLAALQIENHQLREQVERFSQQKNELETQRQGLVEDNRRVNQRLTSIRETAASALAIENENRGLKQRLLSTERDLEAVRQENAKLRDRTARDWFLVGAGVLALGTVIGLVIPRLRLRRRSSWESL